MSAQIKNSFTSIGEVEANVSPSSLSLKLSITYNSVRYFVLSHIHHQVIFYGDYTLYHISNAKELTLAVENIYEKDEIIRLPFSKTLIGFDEKYAIAPAEFSDLMKTGEQLSQRGTNTDIVFETSDALIQVLKRLFQNTQLLHLNSTYLQTLPEHLSDSTQKLFVNIGNKYFDIIRFDQEKKLQLMNRYEYKAVSDFIYFILLCCEELSAKNPSDKIERDKTELVLMGEVDIQSKIYDICYRYFRSIKFIQKPDALYFSKAFDMYPKHLHYNLYNLSA